MHERNEVPTAQEVFDQSAAHLRAQRKICRMMGGKCLYRKQDGDTLLKCAAGALIRDEEYRPWMDAGYDGADTSFPAILRHAECPASLRERLEPHVQLIKDLQVVHDEYQPSLWEERLRWVAAEHGLSYTPPAAKVDDRNDPPAL